MSVPCKPLKPVCLVALCLELLKTQLFEGIGLTLRSIMCTLQSPLETRVSPLKLVCLVLVGPGTVEYTALESN